MPNARIVLAQGAIDGVNTTFATGEPYVPGSAAYILNGRIHNQRAARGPDNDYGFIELDPNGGTIQVDVAPVDGDVVQIFYWDRKVAPAPPIDRLAGVVTSPSRAQGVVREVVPERLTGVVSTKPIQGVVRETQPQRLAGVVRTQRVIGVVKEKCT